MTFREKISAKRELMYQNLCPDHLRIFFIAKLSSKRVQENYTDGTQAAGSIRKQKIYLFVYYISGVQVCTYLRGEMYNLYACNYCALAYLATARSAMYPVWIIQYRIPKYFRAFLLLSRDLRVT